MSTVVGLKIKNNIWVGGDSRASSEDGQIRPFAGVKVFYNNQYLIGFIGSIRAGQLIKPDYFTPPKRVIDWPDVLIDHYETKRCLASDEQQTSMMLSNLIIADRRTSKLYEMLSDFQLNEIDNITVIGSGSSFAYGSLKTSEELNIKDGYIRVELALRSSATFDCATGPPFLIMKLDKP